ncbi:MAG TPA: hypothetical protein PLL36_00870 [Candidatus Hydrogenedentes bacterium]|nr:hypothetical protein [Candidatus Hydrogenedentota bacterium]
MSPKRKHRPSDRRFPYGGMLLAFIVLLRAVPCGAGLTLEKTASSARIFGDHFRMIVDGQYGGTVSEIQLYDGSLWHELFPGPDRGFPALSLQDGGKEYRLALDTSASLHGLRETGGDIQCSVEAAPRAEDGTVFPWRVRLEYLICPEGAVFVNVLLTLPVGAEASGEIALHFDVNETLRHFVRFRDENVAKQGNGFPSARVAFGANTAKSFTNEVEVFVEHKRPVSGEAVFQREGDGRFCWRLGQNGATLKGPFEYRNAFALGCGAAVNGPPKSTVVGQRVFHWVNWLDLEHWYPTEAQIDKMVEANATMLILHMEWMRQRGSNGNPHADYREARNHEEMVKALAYAHQKGLRMGLYMRGIEPYALDSGFFETYCRRDWDGLYVDWHGPTAVSWHESQYDPEIILGDTHYSPNGTHVPAKDYFMFTRRLRDLVGEKGFLIGHQGSFNSGILANLCFDAYLPGETGSDRLMFSDIVEAGYKGMLGGSVCMPWTLDLPAYRNAEGTAKMAAWGVYPHLVMGMKAEHGEGYTFSLEADGPEYAFIMPYWRLLSYMDVEKAEAFNLPGQNRVVLKASDPNVQGVVYRTADAWLVIVANLGTFPVTATLTLDPEALGMSGEYQLTRINAETGAEHAEGTILDCMSTSMLPPWGLEGFRITP